VQGLEGRQKRILWLEEQGALSTGSGRRPALGENHSHSHRQQSDLWCAEDSLRAENSGREVRQKTRGEADAGGRAFRVRRSQEEEGQHHPPLTY
jgi:hypothetical protein